MGGGGSISGFFARGAAPDCGSLVIHTQLLSPDPAILPTLKKGDKLTVSVAGPKGPCAVHYKGKLAGTVIHRQLLQLISCLQQGVRFEATVREVYGGACLVTIKAASNA